MEITATKTRFLEPYKKDKNGNLKPNLPHLTTTKKQSGVYLIKSKRSGKIIYIGFSESNLYKTIYRHFQKWKDISRTVKTRFTYNKEGYVIRVIFTTPARASKLEKYLIQQYLPRDNDFKYKDALTPQQEKVAASIIENSVFISSNDDPF